MIKRHEITSILRLSKYIITSIIVSCLCSQNICTIQNNLILRLRIQLNRYVPIFVAKKLIFYEYIKYDFTFILK